MINPDILEILSDRVSSLNVNGLKNISLEIFEDVVKLVFTGVSYVPVCFVR